MSAEEKLEQHLAAWMTTEDKSFATTEIAATYQQRVRRFQDTLELKKPDRVPTLFLGGGCMVTYGGGTYGDIFYDSEKTRRATLKFMEDFQPEYFVIPPGSSIGSVLDTLGYQAYRWPGGNLPDHIPFQFVEGEYMTAAEYDQLIANPEGFLLRTYVPRAFGKLQALGGFPNLFHLIEITGVGMLLGPLSQPPLRDALDTLLRAADMLKSSSEIAIKTSMDIIHYWGMPALLGGVTFAPFDIISDTLRGTQGALMDMYRCPDKLLAAVDAVIPISIDMATSMSFPGAPPFIFIPLHKGADSFMSNDQFIRFYWPSLKTLMLGIIDAGLVPVPFVEGSYNNRLDIIADDGLPAGKSLWLFDRTDMQEAKRKLGSWACIGGNVPGSLFATGTAEEMENYCRELIETVGADGGFCLAPGVGLEQAKPETLRAFMDSSGKFGVN